MQYVFITRGMLTGTRGSFYSADGARVWCAQGGGDGKEVSQVVGSFDWVLVISEDIFKTAVDPNLFFCVRPFSYFVSYIVSIRYRCRSFLIKKLSRFSPCRRYEGE
jgi:hypothetical protein